MLITTKVTFFKKSDDVASNFYPAAIGMSHHSAAPSFRLVWWASVSNINSKTTSGTEHRFEAGHAADSTDF
jgi:hypothetical protein